MESFDLNLDNYELKDILSLFKIPEDFNEEDLKSAKKVVLMTHPDKSKLDSKYFRFYSQAYKQLFSIWEFRNKKKDNGNKSFQIDEETKKNHFTYHSLQKEQKKALDHILKKNPDNFNEWFNEQFEKTRLKTEEEENGYGNWLISNEDCDDDQDAQVKNLSDMAKEIDKKKSHMRSLILHKDVEDLFLPGLSASQIDGDAPSCYSSDLFSSLPYEDLKKAHTETVIPVTMDDYYNKQKFNSVDEYKQARSIQDISTPLLSEQQSMEYLKNRENLQGKEANERAYKMAKQYEEVERKNKEFWSRILHIER